MSGSACMPVREEPTIARLDRPGAHRLVRTTNYGRRGSMTTSRAAKLLEKIPDDEPVFILRAQDMLSTPCLTRWLAQAFEEEVDAAKIESARAVFKAFVYWQHTHSQQCKVPD